jgi:peptide/nickel transport system substrate-binding protein
MGIRIGSGGRWRRDGRTRWIAIAAAIAIMAGACERAKPAIPANYATVEITVSPISLDPRFASDAMSERVCELIYGSLLRLDHRGIWTGDLAASFERPTSLTIVFHLRRGIHFSDGRPLTARDVVATYDAVLDPATLSVKRAAFAELASITARDAGTVVMTTRRPYAPALEMARLGIVPYGSTLPGREATSVPTGSGPFELASFSRDERITLARNPWRTASAGSISGVSFKVIPDATVRALELAEGLADFGENDAVQLDLIPWLAARSNLVAGRSPGTTYQYLIFNFRDPDLRNINVRRAIAYGIDRAAIVHAMLKDAARPATGLITPQSWAYDGNVTHYDYDPARARALLETAGYDPQHPLRLEYRTTPEGRRLAETLQAMLRPFGVMLEIHTNEWATFYSDLSRGNFAIAASQWVGVNDPHQYALLFASSEIAPHGANRGAYANPAMDQLLAAGDSTIAIDDRKLIYARVQAIAADDLPYISLWWMDNVTVMNRRLHGFEAYPNGSLASLANCTLTGTSAGAAP